MSSTGPSAVFSGPSQGSNGCHWSSPSRLIGRRTCSELAVRTARVVLVEAQAGGLERQAEEVEQRAHLGLGVVDQSLVDHAVDAARQHRVEVRHQPHIVGVIAADVGRGRS